MTETPTYNYQSVESDAQAYWNEHKVFEIDFAEDADLKDFFYCLSMFPYPSGELHMGHVRNYTLSDVMSRYQRLAGKTVFHPIGWDAFGLPAENAAIKKKVNPKDWTENNIQNMANQMKALGFSFDWSKELATCDASYYHWEQWLFCQMYQKGLAYQKSALVNWDPVDKTVLANEQVIDGKGWRSGAPVEMKEMMQWFLRITDYADDLLKGLEHLDGWPDQVKRMQHNWIGYSKGIEVVFPIPENGKSIAVYTTRPDTLMGVTYLAIAAAHPLVEQYLKQDSELQAFVEACSKQSTAEADWMTQEKLGYALPICAEHPITQEPVQIWVANFVLMNYGTGAVMSVPAHDQRDWEFAQKYDLPILQVIQPQDDRSIDIQKEAFTEKGILMNSGDFDGEDFETSFQSILSVLSAKGLGSVQENYRLRDWSISRQRYWGCPIPIIYCDSCGVIPVPEQDLPVQLPEMKNPKPLSEIPEFYETLCPKCHGKAKRETDTFDTFMESSWYYARFLSAQESDRIFNASVKRCLPVDYYVGGIEHAVLHLLYARFFHRVMRDLNLMDSNEPFTKLLLLGMVLKDGKKMSKSSGNSTDLPALLQTYGSDAVRLAVIFSAPPDQAFEWSDRSVDAAARFIRKLWAAIYLNKASGFLQSVQEPCTKSSYRMRYLIHEQLEKAASDYGQRIHFNTVVAGCMELLNSLQSYLKEEATDVAIVHECLTSILIMLSPIIPHVTHHLWFILGYQDSIDQASWPKANSQQFKEHLEKQLSIQVNGKLRGHIQVSSDATEEEIKAAGLSHGNVQKFLEGKQPRRVIYVPNKLINIVV